MDTSRKIVHVRYDGKTYDYYPDELDFSCDVSDSELINIVENLISQTEENVDLEGFEVERYSENNFIDIHPQAKFG
ncbi:MAG: hypothetical protein ACOCV1_00615 [Bacillota bacterium]